MRSTKSCMAHRSIRSLEGTSFHICSHGIPTCIHWRTNVKLLPSIATLLCIGFRCRVFWSDRPRRQSPSFDWQRNGDGVARKQLTRYAIRLALWVLLNNDVNAQVNVEASSPASTSTTMLLPLDSALTWLAPIHQLLMILVLQSTMSIKWLF